MKAGQAHLSFNIVNPLFLLIYLFCKTILDLRKLEVNFNYQWIVFSFVFTILIDESIIKLTINLAKSLKVYIKLLLNYFLS